MFGNHKDRNPLDTIRQIRSCLDKAGIFTIENKWNCFSDNLHSVRLDIIDLPSVGQNGKGITKEYALASAYGEFIERLQNRCSFSKHFGSMRDISFTYPDEVQIKKKNYYVQNIDLLNDLIGEKKLSKIIAGIDENDLLDCLPYYDVKNDNIKYLPSKYLFESCTSNGMCAGNTSEEALVQGLCEIIERHIRKEIYFQTKSVYPTIPHDVLTEYECFRIITDFKNNGFNVIVKDFTLGGVYPVIGILVFNSDKTKIKMSIGSDAIFEAALQRCLTEICQGFNKDSFDSGMVGILIDQSSDFDPKSQIFFYNERLKAYCNDSVNAKGDIPINIFFDDDSQDKLIFKNAFNDRFCDNHNSMKHIIEMLTRNGYDIYIRDNNFLGFPTYSIYIPKMYEVWNLDKFLDSKLIMNEDFIEENKYKILKINQLSNDEIAGLIDLIEMYIEHPIFYSIPLNRSLINLVFGFKAKKEMDLSSLNFNLFLAMCNIKIGNHQKSSKYMEKFLTENNYDVSNINYFRAASLYLKLKASNSDDEYIKSILSITFSPEIVTEIISDISSPDTIFKYYTFPVCGNCSLCPTISQCYYDKWSQIITSINNCMATYFPMQENIRQILQR